MPTFTLSFAPHTRTADAAVRAPRKNLRVFGSDTARLLCGLIVSSSGSSWIEHLGWISLFFLLTRGPACATFCSVTMFSARKPRKPLSELEHLVMEVVWERGSATAEDVRSALAQRHPMKESTVRTML